MLATRNNGITDNENNDSNTIYNYNTTLLPSVNTIYNYNFIAKCQYNLQLQLYCQVSVQLHEECFVSVQFLDCLPGTCVCSSILPASCVQIGRNWFPMNSLVRVA